MEPACSSHAWHTDQAVPCRHLIPLEIALKIVAKIHAGERFAAYILLPMYSEGAPPVHALVAARAPGAVMSGSPDAQMRQD